MVQACGTDGTFLSLRRAMLNPCMGCRPSLRCSCSRLSANCPAMRTGMCARREMLTGLFCMVQCVRCIQSVGMQREKQDRTEGEAPHSQIRQFHSASILSSVNLLRRAVFSVWNLGNACCFIPSAPQSTCNCMTGSRIRTDAQNRTEAFPFMKMFTLLQYPSVAVHF